MNRLLKAVAACLLCALVGTAACTFQGPIRPDRPPVVCVPATPAVPSFTTDVFPIIQQNCSGPTACHFPGGIGPFTLTSYSAIKTRVDDRVNNTGNILRDSKLANSINHFGQTTSMPYLRDKLDECSIAIINNWIVAGAPNN
jgi:hypothetical protein